MHRSRSASRDLDATDGRRRRTLIVLFVVIALVAMMALAVGAASGDVPESGAAPTVEAEAGPLRELPGRRTATSNTFLLPGGRLETRLYASPVNYRDDDGDWEPIDESLEEPPGGGLTNAANSFDLHLPDQMGAGSVRLTREDQWLSYRLLGEQTDEAEVKGGTAVYDAAAGDVSFELHSLANGLKEEIVLADSSQPSSYSYALELSQGLIPSLLENGSIKVEDSDGTLFATLPAPTIADASGDLSAEAVHYVLQEGSEEGRWTLAVAADEAWLSDPARAWPVTIDPSALIATEQDCVIGSLPSPKGWSKCGASGATELAAGYVQSESQPIRTFLRFKFGSQLNPVLPANTYIGKAVLKLYAPKPAENTVPGLETRRVTQDWSTALNWQQFKTNNFIEPYKWTTPGGDFNSEGKAEVLTSKRGTGAGPWEFTSESLRVLAQGWVEHNAILGGGIKNQGLVVKQIDETKTAECIANPANCPRRYVGFNSSAAASNKPELDLIYFPKAPATNKMLSPSEGTTTARRLQLRAGWAPGVSGVRFQYRAAKKGPFTDIPPALLRNGNGEAVEELVVSESCCQSEPLYFDAAHVNGELQSKGGPIQVRALFEGGSGAGFSEPVEAKVDRYLGGPKDATASMGPGTLDLLTGNLTLGATDVSIGGFNPLEFSRTYNTRAPGTTGEKAVLGQGWKPGAPVEEAGGSEWASIKVTSEAETIEGESYSFEYAKLVDLEGYEIPFEKQGESYAAPPELTGYSLVLSEGRFVLTDPGGNKTTFGNENSGNSSEYLPLSVTQPGSGPHSTVMTWKFEGTQRRLVRIVAPTASKSPSECAENPIATSGCRTLEFTYAPASNWGAPSGYGERLQKITFYASGEGGPWEVAAYSYDNQGRLVSEWDPRLGVGLKTSYAYEGEKLAKVTPPGQEPWLLEYTPNLDGETGPVSRLKAVKRSNLQGGETKTSIRYEVPLSGSGAPYDLSSGEVAKWGQVDLPTDATAVFPPSEVPAEPASSYARAALTYMDSEGFGVNTASPPGAGTSGSSISTTETDQFGNVIRELSAQNRLRALADPEGKTAERSHQLDTQRTYSLDGTMLVAETGPAHQVKLQEGGEVLQARFHRSIAYGNPENISPAPLLPTWEQTSAIPLGKGTELEQQVSETKYNWALRKPIETIADVGIGHLNVKRKTSYNSSTGLPTEVRQPKASEEGGNVPGATKTIYYGELTGPTSCFFSPKWAGLPCQVKPAAQPAEGPAMPVTWFKSYSPLGQPTEIVEETPGAGEAGIRKTVLTYDAAGRQLTKTITGGGVPVPKTETTYNPTLGMPSAQRIVCPESEPGCDTQETSAAYDALGRPTSYQDADGVTAKTTYDSLGRPATVDDGKGTQTMHYDSVTGLLTELEDSAAGVFTADYDADGNLVKRGLPNGLTAETTYDSTGSPVALDYTKTSNCGLSCDWLSFAVERSVRGQILVENSTLGKEEYEYDRLGRLTVARETPTGGSCTTRAYAFDKDSNRTELTTTPGAVGSCSLSGGSTQKYSYDAADRLLGESLTYDNFGRITNLPGSLAGGKALSTTYFANDMVATQSQNGVTNTFQLDATLRQRQRIQAGGLEGAEVFHYAGSGDSPSWTQRGSTWTRSIVGIGGELAAIQESGKEVELQLTNLHGDVSATAALSSSVTDLKATFTYDEFGNQLSASSAGRFSWLGAKLRRTELTSGVIQMGVRSYVPQMGRFLSTDPVSGGSANSYDYANADPVNAYDPSGEAACQIAQKSLSAKNHVSASGTFTIKAKAWAHCSRAARKVHTKGILLNGGYSASPGSVTSIDSQTGPTNSCGNGGPKFSCEIPVEVTFDARPSCGERWPGTIDVLFSVRWETAKGKIMEATETVRFRFYVTNGGAECIK